MSMNKLMLKMLFAKDRYFRTCSLTKKLPKYFGVMFVFMGPFFLDQASAWELILSNVSNSYSNCSYTETDTDATFRLTIGYNKAQGNVGYANFFSRGILLYTYNQAGMLNQSSNIASSVTIDNAPSSGVYRGIGYAMYYGNSGSWFNTQPLSAEVKITLQKKHIENWPAVGIRAGNYTSGDDVGEISGVAYIGLSAAGNNCNVIVDPELPPPAVNPKVSMTAPDWDLGELQRGEETVLTLPATKDQLCFSYEGVAAITDQKYIINATNTNGLSASGSYLLKSLEDSSQTVPYTLMLANSKDSVMLPNTQNRLFTLDAGGKTCFSPTFKAQPDKAVKGGAYSDILTFTVVTKP